MREIKFRGKRIDNGEWVVGDYSRYSKEASIIMVDLLEEEDYWVSNETVGQYTGLKDKNGVEIYEGDVIFFQPFGTHSNDRIVKYKDGMFVGELVRNGYDDGPLGKSSLDMYEVIGNIHDKEG